MAREPRYAPPHPIAPMNSQKQQENRIKLERYETLTIAHYILRRKHSYEMRFVGYKYSLYRFKMTLFAKFSKFIDHTPPEK